MTRRDHDGDLAGAARRLHADHLAFDRRFDDLCERARAGDWHELDEVWSAFVGDVERHLAFEEEQLFPAFSRRDPEGRALTLRLLEQHARLRRTLEAIGLQIQLKEIRAATIEATTALMREHAGVENATIYPWAARAASSG